MNREGHLTRWGRGLAVVAVVLGLAAGCSTIDSPTVIDQVTVDPSSSPRTDPGIDGGGISIDVLDGLERANEDGIMRWEQPTVSVSVSGQPTERDLDIVFETLGSFLSFTGIEFSSADGGGDIDIAFVDHDTWPPPDPDSIRVDPFGDPVDDLGVTTWQADFAGALREAQVYVDPAIPQALRNSTISHELTHALGLGHVGCVTSIVDNSTQLDLGWEPTPYDEDLIATWYDPAIPLLSTASELEDYVTISAGAPECAPWTIQGVQVDDDVLACEFNIAQYQSCMVYDGNGPLPSLDAWTPTHWADDDTVYSYDPARYEEVDVDGVRVLCELSWSNERRACQTTDGPGPITNPDLWTDGEYVYDEP